MYTFMNTQWSDYQIFIAVAETQSFSAAARLLKLTQPTVSRRIAALEENIGGPLFRRDRKGTHLTNEGTKILVPAQQMARWAAEIERQCANFEDKPQGLVKVAAPPGLAFEFVVPFAAFVQKQHPDLRVDLITGVETIDLTRGDVDLALRTKAPTQKELMVLARLSFKVGVFVSASLKEELMNKRASKRVKASTLPWVTWGYPMEHIEPRPTLEARFDDFKIGFASNDYLAQQRAAECGLGAMIVGKVKHRFSPWASLVEIETDLPLNAAHEMYIVCARSMKDVPRVRAVFNLLCDELEYAEGVSLEKNPTG